MLKYIFIFLMTITMAHALDFNESSYQIQYDPQGFGISIIQLQNEIVSLSKTNNYKQLQAAQDRLEDYLAAIATLESPLH